METNKWRRTEHKVFEILSKYQTITSVPVMVYGERREWSEGMVRAFQILVNKSSEDEFAELKENVRIYSGPIELRRMIIRRDGKFENEFEGGFFDGNANMSFEIL